MDSLTSSQVRTSEGLRVGGSKRAVVYVRVSSSRQVNRSRSNSDGYSLPAQLDGCAKKAVLLDATVVTEYVERAESATTDGRPQLQAMLQRVESLRDVDYVIVHKIDRFARNRFDDAVVHFRLREAGATLVSATEHIDETPAGMLTHGILATIAEFYSNNLSAEIRKGRDAKARAGGTNGRAPIGYLNKREITGQRDVRWVEPDPERAPHIQWAFDAYASGDYSLRQLTEELAARGLRTLGTAKFPSRALYLANVAKMLHNPYYVGTVRYNGADYAGEHEPLVDMQTFLTVQAMFATKANGEKQRSHQHYLRSTLYCANCGSRLCFSRSTGRGGAYDYFFCLGRHQKRTDCSLPYLGVHRVEELVEDHYRRSVSVAPDRAEQLLDALTEALKSVNAAAQRESAQQNKRVKSLLNRREKLVDAYEFGSLSKEQLRDRQDRIEAELTDARQRAQAFETTWDTIQENLAAAFELATDCADTYASAKPMRRRQMNQTFFQRLLVHVDPIDGSASIAEAEYDDLYARLLDPALPEQLRVDSPRGSETANPGPVSWARGSKEDNLVEPGGIEPPSAWRITYLLRPFLCFSLRLLGR